MDTSAVNGQSSQPKGLLAWDRVAAAAVSMQPQSLSIDWIAPPFAGHLFPMLKLASELSSLGFDRQRVFCTPAMRSAVEGAGLEFQGILGDREEAILAVANGHARVGARPGALVRQLRETLGFLGELSTELDAHWERSAPAIVIADSVLPTAGFAARRHGARWWTSMASVSPTETRTGTPAYLGGWAPGTGLLTSLRDRVGRAATRAFKRTAGWTVRKELRAMGVSSVYRKDGTEVCYSDDRILGLAHPEFEFERDWPEAMRLVGYPIGSPVRASSVPEIASAGPHVLVTLGTHLLWAKEEALRHATELAALLPEWTVHFSHGDARGSIDRTEDNLRELSYVPYGNNLAGYRAICHHAGAGITYAALAAGVPALVWPRDFDQFDNAARVLARGAGLRTKGKPSDMAAKLRRLDQEPGFRDGARMLGAQVSKLEPHVEVARFLSEAAGPS